MKYGAIQVCNITGGLDVQKIEAGNIEEAWQKADDGKSKHEEVIVFPLNEGNRKAVVDLLDDQVKTTILEALRDYRKWWDEGCGFWKEKVDEIDAALNLGGCSCRTCITS